MAKQPATADPPASEQPEGKAKGMICQDEELIAMQKINRILTKLEPKAKIRVVSWLKDKIEFPLIDIPKG